MLIDIELVARTGGIRVLLQMLADGPLEISQLLTPIFLYIVDLPRTRNYLHAGTDLEVMTLVISSNIINLISAFRSRCLA